MIAMHRRLTAWDLQGPPGGIDLLANAAHDRTVLYSPWDFQRVIGWKAK